ncbi:OmpL47-type beta-barrel domain-containing protein [Methanooceanicella nereidis]|uniref:OmpL47-type beta-barrel domain-containing protein n=1 Tax=Methanooceanicella nereidis TaxID=2052831 RepID=UPI001E49B9A3|nr:FlgD immunoglobulin-like domain containing protein [Methanocella sp. CWC-04]
MKSGVPSLAVVIILCILIAQTVNAASPTVNDLLAEPHIIKSPQPTTISYTLDDVGISRVILEIYDQNNVLVRNIDQGVKSSGSYSIVWDGCDNNGNYLEDGIYSVRVNSTDIYSFSKKWGQPSDIISSSYPLSVIVNGSGNVFVSGFNMYMDNNVYKTKSFIYVFNPDGTYQESLILGESTNFMENLPLDMAFNSSGYMFVTEPVDVVVYSPDLSYYGRFGVMGNGTGEFLLAMGIDIDQSNDHIYVADSYNNRIQVFDSDYNFVDTWGMGGTEPGNFTRPFDLAINSSGYVYVADYGNKRVQVFSSDGSLVSAWSSDPGGVSGIAINDSDFVYVTNDLSDNVSVFDKNGNFLYTWDITNEPLPGFIPLRIPIDIGLNDEVYYPHIYVSATDMSMSNFICVTDSEGNSLDTIDFISQPGGFSGASGIAVNSSGYIYVVDKVCIQIFDPDGNFVGYGSNLPRCPNSIAINSSDHVYVTDYMQGTVFVFDPDNNFVRSWSLNFDMNFFGIPLGMTIPAYLYDIAIDQYENVYVTNMPALPMMTGNYKIKIYDPNGNPINSWCGGDIFSSFFDLLINPPTDEEELNEFMEKWGDLWNMANNMFDFSQFTGIAINSSGYVYTVVKTNSTYSNILVINQSGVIVNGWGGYGSQDGQINTPYGIAINSSDYVFVADSGNDRFQIFDPAGNFVYRLGVNGSGDGEFKGPTGIEINGDDDVLIADTGNYRVQVFEYFINVFDDAAVYVDSIPPVSSVVLYGTSGTGGWYTSDVTGSIIGIDNVSGVDHSQYSFDCNDWTDGSTFTVSSEGTGKVYYRSVDNGGNIELAKNVTISIDKTLPVAYCSLDGLPGNNGWYISEVAVTLTANDGVSGVAKIEYNIDGAGWTDYACTFNISEGQHILTYRSVDIAGNIGDSESETINVDMSAPIIQCSLSGSKANQGWFESDVTVTLTASDSISGINYTEYSIEGVNWNIYVKPFKVPLDRQKTIFYRTVDNASNPADGSQFIYFPPQSVPNLYSVTTPVTTPTATAIPSVSITPTTDPSPTPVPVTPTPEPSMAISDDQWNDTGLLLILLALAIISGVAAYFLWIKPRQ